MSPPTGERLGGLLRDDPGRRARCYDLKGWCAKTDADCEALSEGICEGAKNVEMCEGETALDCLDMIRK
jgi:hypothetical protein